MEKEIRIVKIVLKTAQNEAIRVQCKLIDKRSTFGRKEFLVKPLNQAKSIWVLKMI